ncbi:MAG: rod shape-determining protein RodA [Mucilaginibacter polytrichastri]|nr:rod shape-determining protein RodA [Mucilaginibacter polytrichastri]
MTTNNERSFFFNVDWFTVLIYLSLCVIGWFNIHAAVYDENNPSIIDLDTNYGKQFIFIIGAIALGTTILLLDSKFFAVFAPVFYVITVILLIIVLFVGRNVGGNQAWIPLGSFRLQPSEFAKFSTILLLARYLSSSNNIRVNDLKTQAICAAIIGFPMLLIMLQPDTGSTLTFFSLILVLYREGLSPAILIVGVLMIALFILALLVNQLYLIAGLVIITALLVYFFWRKRKIVFTLITAMLISVAFVFSVDFLYDHVLEPHQKARIDELLGISSDLKGAGYNVNQSKIAIGSGKLLGKGYLKGTQTKYNFVPEQETDFIFCTIGEEWGFVGSSVIVGLFLVLLIRVVALAERQRSQFSRIYGYGVACILFFHFFVNIGMTIGIMPVIGIPLPFISYGGSSLWSFTILLFILLKLDSNRMGLV